nr:hypothetical protein CFP56_27107 [Quercus suber]POE84301.1 hypothetical protein CFP56_74561 [Quercus suber]
MTAQGPTASGPVQRLVSYKEYVVEIVQSIIKDTDMYVCGKHATEDLGVSGLFVLGAAHILNVELSETKAELEATIRRFKDCLKQVTALYPNLDLSQVVINDIVSPVPSGVDTVLNEADGVIHLVEGKVKELAQIETNSSSVLKGQTVTEGLFVPKGSSAPESQFVLNAPLA